MPRTDYRKLCVEIFGTDNEAMIRELAGKWKKKPPRNMGRKKALSAKDVEKIQTLLKDGVKIQEIASRFGVSRKSISQYLNQRPEGNYTMRIDYKHGRRVCTVIYVDFLAEQILIQNRTDDLLDRAFGTVETPTWEDFEQFLLSRCFPKSRGHVKPILKNLDISQYDPLAIVEATGGRTAEDDMYLTFKNYPKEAKAYADH